MSNCPEIMDFVNEMKDNFDSDIKALDGRIKELQNANAKLKRRIESLENRTLTVKGNL